MPIERDHHLRTDVDPFLLHQAGGLEDRADLHLVNLRVGDAEPASAVAEHRVHLGELVDLLPQLDEAPSHVPRERRDLRLGVRQELVERRIEQTDRRRHPAERAEDPREIVALEGDELLESRAPSLLVSREDHLAHGHDAILLEEHVLGPAQADALRAEEPRDPRVLRGVRIRPDAELAHLIGPFEEPVELAEHERVLGPHRSLEQHLDHLGRARLDPAAENLAGGAVDRDPIAFTERPFPARSGARSGSSPRGGTRIRRCRASPSRARRPPHGRSGRRGS